MDDNRDADEQKTRLGGKSFFVRYIGVRFKKLEIAMILNKEQVKRLYGRMARFYDLALGGYRLLGVTRHRRRAVSGLRLNPGDTVVDLGCGTGANFESLQKAVGSSGRIIGVDLSPAMLARAQKRADQAGWKNVELVEADLEEWRVPPGTDGVLATFALEMVPEYDAVVKRLAGRITPGKRLALLGLKHPEGWPEWLVEFGIWLNKPFGVSREYERFRPWESVERHMTTIEFKELLLGAAYRCIGECK